MVPAAQERLPLRVPLARRQLDSVHTPLLDIERTEAHLVPQAQDTQHGRHKARASLEQLMVMTRRPCLRQRECHVAPQTQPLHAQPP